MSANNGRRLMAHLLKRGLKHLVMSMAMTKSALRAGGGSIEFELAGDNFPHLTNHCTDILMQSAKYFPPPPVGPVLFEGCPHVPRHFFIFHLPFIVTQSILWGFARLFQPRSYLEIGTLYGSSLLAITKGSKGSIERVMSIDLNAMTQKIAEENLRASSYAGEALFLVGNSRTLKVEGEFDVVYVDGDHTFKGARADIKKFWRHVRPGGYLAVDNTVDNILPKTTNTLYTYTGANEVTDFEVLEAMIYLVSRNKLPGLDSVVYQYPSWSGFGLMHKAFP